MMTMMKVIMMMMMMTMMMMMMIVGALLPTAPPAAHHARAPQGVSMTHAVRCGAPSPAQPSPAQGGVDGTAVTPVFVFSI